MELKNQREALSHNADYSDGKDESDKKAMRILALGDSLTSGHGIQLKDAYPQLLETKLLEKFSKYNTQIINAGISGSTTASSVGRLQKFIDEDIDILLLSLGSNDGLRGLSLDSMKQNLQNTIDLAHLHNIKVVLAGHKIPLNRGLKYRNKFEKVFKDLAKDNKLKFIPFLLEDVALKADLNLPDGFHPNEKGHQVMVETIYPYIKSFYNK